LLMFDILNAICLMQTTIIEDSRKIKAKTRVWSLGYYKAYFGHGLLSVKDILTTHYVSTIIG